MNKPELLEEQPDFSLVLGGLLFRFYRKVYLSGDELELARRRVLVIAGVTWLPLLLLSMIGGHAMRGTLNVPFFYDIEAHVRFLVALPALIIAEVVVHSRIKPAVKRFVERHLIVAEDMPKFEAAIDSATRLRNSVIVEITLLVLVYTLGLWLWWNQIATGAASWYAMPDGTRLQLTLAGYWYAFVSIPIFQFILLRWYMRFFIWFQFLWRVSRIKLNLIATHPDRAAGIGFLGQSIYSFVPILFAQGTMLSGLIASRVLHDGQNLMSFKTEAVGFVGFFVLFILSPLVLFAPQLARAKREGLSDYGALASIYVRVFEKKWIHGGASKDEELIGSADIQSLADLGNSFGIIQEMHLVPFDLKDVGRLAAVTAAPLLPLGLMIFSLEELLTRLIKILF